MIPFPIKVIPVIFADSKYGTLFNDDVITILSLKIFFGETSSRQVDKNLLIEWFLTFVKF